MVLKNKKIMIIYSARDILYFRLKIEDKSIGIIILKTP